MASGLDISKGMYRRRRPMRFELIRNLRVFLLNLLEDFSILLDSPHPEAQRLGRSGHGSHDFGIEVRFDSIRADFLQRLVRDIVLVEIAQFVQEVLVSQLPFRLRPGGLTLDEYIENYNFNTIEFESFAIEWVFNIFESTICLYKWQSLPQTISRQLP